MALLQQIGSRNMRDLESRDTVQLILIMLQTKYKIIGYTQAEKSLMKIDGQLYKGIRVKLHAPVT